MLSLNYIRELAREAQIGDEDVEFVLWNEYPEWEWPKLGEDECSDSTYSSAESRR